MRKLIAVVGAATLLLAGCGHGTQNDTSLIGSLNPDVTQATIRSTICVSGWTSTIRPPASYTSDLKRKQLRQMYPKGGAIPSHFEEDHLMPLELGGAPRDPANLKPIPLKRAKSDDVQENKLHREVCDGTLSLAEAQREMSEVKRS